MIHFLVVFLFGLACLVWGYNAGFRDADRRAEKIFKGLTTIYEIAKKVGDEVKNNNK